MRKIDGATVTSHLDSRFAQLEKQKVEFIRRVGGWSTGRLGHRPSLGAWSAIEVYDHLARTEAAILNEARRGIGKPHRIGISDMVRTKFLNGVFQSPRRVKVPASAQQVLPDQHVELSDVLERWRLCRLELADFLRTTPGEKLERGIFKHPVGGWMNASGILSFFSIHIYHHKFQIDRIESSFLSPSPG